MWRGVVPALQEKSGSFQSRVPRGYKGYKGIKRSNSVSLHPPPLYSLLAGWVGCVWVGGWGGWGGWGGVCVRVCVFQLMRRGRLGFQPQRSPAHMLLIP